jgi:hypothetical protein
VQEIRIAQNGAGTTRPPSFDEHGLLHTYRSLDFEPALDPELRWEDCFKRAESWLLRRLPLIISVHSINFHSTLAPFRQRTLPLLDALLTALKKRFPDLLYVSDEQLLEIVETGGYQSASGTIPVAVRGMRRGAEA